MELLNEDKNVCHFFPPGRVDTCKHNIFLSVRSKYEKT